MKVILTCTQEQRQSMMIDGFFICLLWKWGELKGFSLAVQDPINAYLGETVARHFCTKNGGNAIDVHIDYVQNVIRGYR